MSQLSLLTFFLLVFKVHVLLEFLISEASLVVICIRFWDKERYEDKGFRL